MWSKKLDRIKHSYGIMVDKLGNKVLVGLSDLQGQEMDKKEALDFKTTKKRNRAEKCSVEEYIKNVPYKRQCAEGTATFENMDKNKVIPSIIKILSTLDLGVDGIAVILDSIHEQANSSSSKITHITTMLDTKI